MTAPTAPPSTSRAARAVGWSDVAGRGLRPSHGWRVPLRMAMRDLRRHPGRTAAAGVMVLVPVLLACVVAVFLSTSSVSTRERVLEQMASAEAVVLADGTVSPPEQPSTTAGVAELVGAPVVEVRRGSGLRVQTGDTPPVTVDVLATDLADPVTDGLVTVREGRLPQNAAEVALSPGLARDLGVGVGEDVTVGGSTRTVSGLAYEVSTGAAIALAVLTADDVPPGSTDPFASSWLVPDADGIVMGQPDDTSGLYVVGRGTAADYAESFDGLGTLGGVTVVMIGVALALVVLEIALLAGPAFAVGVRQQQQTLALLAATGGDGRALRRVVLAQALVVGAGASLLGASLATGLTALAVVLGRSRTDMLLGPLEVPWAVVVGFVAVGVVASVASATAPALSASRATVVGALAPRTAERRVPWRRPLLGSLLLVGGTGMLLVAVRDAFGDSAILGALAVLVMGVGMVLVVPLPVALLGRASTRLPLGMRLAGRESTRAATRSVAAVAAVAGASAALVAGLTVTAAIRTQDATAYVPRSAYGVTTIYTSFTDVDPADVAERVGTAVPDAEVAPAGELGYAPLADGREANRTFWLPSPGCDEIPPAPTYDGPADPCWTAWADEAGIAPLALALDATAAELRGYDLTRAQRSVLDDGGVLVAAGSRVDVSAGTLPVAIGSLLYPQEPGGTGSVEVTDVPVATWDPSTIASTSNSGGVDPALLVSPRAAEALGVSGTADVLVRPAGVDETSTPDEVREATAPVLRALSPAAKRNVWTEIGYVDSWRVVDLVVVLAAALVVLGATFTATALALADARRDRTVLTAVGASPATQRVTAGSTAAIVAGTGAVVGTLVGLVVGLVVADAVLQPSVVSTVLGLGAGTLEATLLVGVAPWGWIAGFVVGLPVLAGLVVAAVASGRPDTEAARLTGRAA